MMFLNSGSQYSFYKLDDNGNGQTENDHCGDWKIKLKVFLFDPDIPGQFADPVQPVMKEVNQYTQKHDQHSCNNYVSAGVTIHIAKIIFTIGNTFFLLAKSLPCISS